MIDRAASSASICAPRRADEARLRRLLTVQTMTTSTAAGTGWRSERQEIASRPRPDHEDLVPPAEVKPESRERALADGVRRRLDPARARPRSPRPAGGRRAEPIRRAVREVRPHLSSTCSSGSPTSRTGTRTSSPTRAAEDEVHRLQRARLLLAADKALTRSCSLPQDPGAGVHARRTRPPARRRSGSDSADRQAAAVDASIASRRRRCRERREAPGSDPVRAREFGTDAAGRELHRGTRALRRRAPATNVSRRCRSGS